ncbi:uncharacterized protein LOC103509861 [Diaphorina citri]|uniref:Uncharacterized protein LOC103509861 n=1 Tax=Diaphorina citri TaxID=121845 RepID=A0A1S4EC77_DIACI|nr:uncharacterized protein LOC103509861 [Diaphorina citri]
MDIPVPIEVLLPEEIPLPCIENPKDIKADSEIPLPTCELPSGSNGDCPVKPLECPPFPPFLSDIENMEETKSSPKPKKRVDVPKKAAKKTIEEIEELKKAEATTLEIKMLEQQSRMRKIQVEASKEKIQQLSKLLMAEDDSEPSGSRMRRPSTSSLADDKPDRSTASGKLSAAKLRHPSTSSLASGEKSAGAASPGDPREPRSGAWDDGPAGSDSEIEEGQLMSCLHGVRVYGLKDWAEFNATRAEVGGEEFREAKLKERKLQAKARELTGESDRKVTNVFDTPQNKINIGFFKWSEHPVRLDTIFTTRTQPPLEFAENPLHASRHLNPTGRFYDQFAALGDSFVQKKLEFINNTTFKRKLVKPEAKPVEEGKEKESEEKESEPIEVVTLDTTEEGELKEEGKEGEEKDRRKRPRVEEKEVINRPGYKDAQAARVYTDLENVYVWDPEYST